MSATTSLAALLFVELVGFNDLLETDEKGALGILGRYRELVEPIIGEHDGEIIDITGSEMLAVFGSAVASVQCSLHLALGVRGALAGELTPRLGLHLGEVWREGGKLYGNGVNVAARVMQAAVPGALLVSEDIHAQVATKLDLCIQEVPSLPLRNIDRLMALYEIDTGRGFLMPVDGCEPGPTAGREPKSGSSSEARRADTPGKADSSLAWAIRHSVAEVLRQHADIDIDPDLQHGQPLRPKRLPVPPKKPRPPHHGLKEADDGDTYSGGRESRSLSINLSTGEGIQVRGGPKVADEPGMIKGGAAGKAAGLNLDRRRSKAARDISSGVKSLVFYGLAGAAFAYGYIQTDSFWYLAGAVLIGFLPVMSSLRKLIGAGSELRSLAKQEKRGPLTSGKR
ncbi:MAG: adenylate/guanylate cyclase domain-containing protein [Spirochaetales bacterium]|nr:MAG: adenylate/guanylate cyclase domain-containing protein [Spirochaetales bacterium]